MSAPKLSPRLNQIHHLKRADVTHVGEMVNTLPTTEGFPGLKGLTYCSAVEREVVVALVISVVAFVRIYDLLHLVVPAQLVRVTHLQRFVRVGVLRPTSST